MPENARGPLDGIRVVDLSTVVAGPYATQMMGDLGAEIIKVEPPTGDIMRAPGPARSPGMGAAFLNCNRNKERRVLDLRLPADRQMLLEMIDGADVFVHNMRMDAARRAGLGPDELLSRNPRLVYCAIVGFGQDGPYRDKPAYDDIIQAASGWAGVAAQAGDEPRYAPTIAADKITSLFALSAINAALFHRASSGVGQAIEVPMFETMASFLLVEHLAGRTFVPPEGPAGYARVLSQHRRPQRTADGHIAVLPYTATHWVNFFACAGRDDYAADEDLSSDAARAGKIDTLYQRLAACLAKRTTAEWLQRLEPLQIPCSAVNMIDDLLEDPHLRAVGFFQTVEHPSEGTMLSVRPPIKYSRTPSSVRTLAPER